MIQDIPLSKLVLSSLNVRQDPDRDTAMLEASIEAHGLLAPLIVHRMPRGKFGVYAGGRRLRALQALAERGAIKLVHPVTCDIRDDSEGEALEVSIAENLARLALPAAIEFEAYARLEAAGADHAEVARRFATTELRVRQMMRLGNLHPEIRAAFRDAAISLDAAQAFASTADQALQKRVFEDVARTGYSAGAIRGAIRRLTDTDGVDGMLRLVGWEAYLAAGGSAEADLFDPDSRGRVLDPNLLLTMYRDRIAAERDRLAARLPGSVSIQMGYDGIGAAVRVDREVSDDQDRRLGEIDLRLDAVGDRLEDIADYEPGDEFDPETWTASAGPHEQDEVDRLAAEAATLSAERADIVQATMRVPEGRVIAVARVDEGRLAIAGYYRPLGYREPLPKPVAGSTPAGAAPAAPAAPAVRDGIAPEPSPGGASPDALLRAEHGLSKEMVDVMRSIRRQTLQAALMATADGRRLAGDLLAYSTLRSMLSGTMTRDLGVHRAGARDYDPPIAADDRRHHLAAHELDRLEARYRAADWMVILDPAAGFHAFAALDAAARAEAAAFAGVLMLSRSLNAPGYGVQLHDVLAGLAGVTDETIRLFWSPDRRFFDRLPKAQRLDLLRDLDPGLEKRAPSRDADLSDAAAKIFTASRIDGEKLGLGAGVLARARGWVPEYLHFPQAVEPPEIEPTLMEKFIRDGSIGEAAR